MEETILGTQGNGVQSCAKHFLGNEQETMDFPTTKKGITIQALS